MLKRPTSLALTLGAVLLSSACTSAPRIERRQAPVAEIRSKAFEPGVHIVSPFLVEPYRRLLRNSPTFRDALLPFLDDGEHTLVIGYDQDLLDVVGPWKGNRANLAHIYPLPGQRPNRAAVVVLGTGAIESKALQMGYDREALIEDLSVLIGHEVYGHILPVWAGEVAECTDQASEGLPCSIERENRIRAEIGWTPRESHADVDLGFICLARPSFCRSHEPR